MKHLVIILLLLACQLSPCSAQTLYTGYQFWPKTNEYTAFKYTREYEEETHLYWTTYHIYSPTTGYPIYIITGLHNKGAKEILVAISDADGGYFAQVHTEEITYDIPSMKSFGISNPFTELFGKKHTNYLLVKFVSTKYENIKVQEFRDKRYGDLVYYTLDK